MDDVETQSSYSSLKFCNILQHVIPYLDHVPGLESSCSLLQVSTAVRHTVQSSRAHCMIIVYPDRQHGGVCSWERLAAAMCWLPRHAGLVSDLVIHDCYDDQVSMPFVLLEQALQLCAQNAALASLIKSAATTAAGAAAHGTLGSCTSSGAAVYAGSVAQHAAPRCPLPLCLERLCISSMPPPAVLRLLQSAGVQTLQVHFVPADMPLSVFPALASLQTLTYLSLGDEDEPHHTEVPVALAAAVGELRHLKSFSVYGLTAAGSRLLLVSLRKLHLHHPEGDNIGGDDIITVAADAHMMSLSHLTALTSLSWENYRADLCDVTLPRQAVKLSSVGRLHLVGPHNLPEVSIITVHDGCGWELLPQLALEPHTRDLQFYFSAAVVRLPGAIERIGTAFGALTNLTALEAESNGHELPALVMQQLCKLPSLLSLSISVYGPHQDIDESPEGSDDPPEDVDDLPEGFFNMFDDAINHHQDGVDPPEEFINMFDDAINHPEALVQLPAAEHQVNVAGMLQLSALTSLTKLRVGDTSGAGFGNVEAAAVASLTRLQELELDCRNMQTAAVLPALTGLTGLRSLALLYQDAFSDLEPALLQQLSSLSLLTSLQLGSQPLSDEDRQQLMTAMPSLISLITA